MSEQYYNHFDRKGISTSSKYNPYKLIHTQRLTQVIYDNAYKLGVNPNKIKDRSNFFLTEFYLNGIAALLMHDNCDKSYSDKIKVMKKLSEAECMQYGFKESSSLRLMKKSLKIGLSYFFYKHGFIKSLLFVHYLRNKQSNSHILNR